MNESAIRERVNRAISEEVFPGCVVGIENNAKKILPFGHFTYEQNSNLIREDTVYDVASITKTIPVALIALTFMELNQPKFMGAYAHQHMIGKTGFTGISYVIDPKRDRAVVILSNRTYPHRPGNTDSINAFWRDIADIVFAG